MLRTEKRAAASLALVYASRMLGLFMILPVFSLYAEDYEGATPLLTGLAIGIYGLTQGLFQLPFGMLSDRYGRKAIIITGLVIFGAGSVVAAVADNIYLVIAGRALQGLGAIAAAVMALAADLTREEIRLRVMALIGMSIGASFMLSMVLGPVFAATYGMSFIFWLTAGLAVFGVLIVLFVTPQPVSQGFHRDTQLSWPDVGKTLANRELLKLDFGVFALHLVLSASFVVLPLVLFREMGITQLLHWQTYLPVFLLSVLLMVPMIIVAEKKQKSKAVFVSAVVMLLVAELSLSQWHSYWSVFAALVVFFGAFNLLEAMMPTVITRIAPADMKGTAMGLFSSAQFLGAFCGGLTGGLLLTWFDYWATFLSLSAIVAAWVAVALTMKFPMTMKSRVVSLKQLDEDQMRRFAARVKDISGIKEVAIYPDDRVAYLKVDKDFSDADLNLLLEN